MTEAPPLSFVPRELVHALARFVPCEAAFFARSTRANWQRFKDDEWLFANVVELAMLSSYDKGWDFLWKQVPRLARKYPGLDRFTPVIAMEVPECTRAFAVSPSGAIIVQPSFKHLHIADRAHSYVRLDDVAVPVGQGGWLERVEFSPGPMDGGLCACTGFNVDMHKRSIIWVYESSSWMLKYILPATGKLWTCLCFLDETTLAAAAGDGTVLTRNVIEGDTRFHLASTGNYALDGDNNCKVLAASRSAFAVGTSNI